MIERTEGSELSVQAFCQAEGISAHQSCYAWRKCLDAPTSSVSIAADTTGEGTFLGLGVLDSEAPGAFT